MSIIWSYCSCETIDIDFYGHISSKMAYFCSKGISTVTGQVSLMPQTAVVGRGLGWQNSRIKNTLSTKKKFWNKSSFTCSYIFQNFQEFPGFSKIQFQDFFFSWRILKSCQKCWPILVREGLKKNPLNLWSWSYLAGIRWKRQDLYGHLYWK